MMKSVSVSVCKVILAFLLCALIFLPCGCGPYAQPGETEAEGNRRHIRNLAISQQQLMEDIDRIMLFDKPSKLSEKRIP